MSSQAVQSNWVERRFQRERKLAEHSPKVWDAVRAQIQDACESFNRCYSQDVDVKFENGHRLKIVRAKRSGIVVIYSADKRTITAAYDAPGTTFEFQIDADDKRAFVIDGQDQLDPDKVSQRILEPLLFPSDVPGIVIPRLPHVQEL